MRDITELLNSIGYKFKDESLVRNAMTHSSYINEHLDKFKFSNERLEFLGDAVLDLIVGEYFYLESKKFNEGDLTKLRANAVNEYALYDIARSINLGEYLLLGKGEIKQNGNLRTSILSDALEALIGAIFLDSNFETTKEVVLKIFKDKLENVEKSGADSDFKTKLQELNQNKKIKSIKYDIYKEEGPDNNKIFYCKLDIDNKTFYGKGTSKKRAEQDSAKEALLYLGEI